MTTTGAQVARGTQAPRLPLFTVRVSNTNAAALSPLASKNWARNSSTPVATLPVSWTESTTPHQSHERRLTVLLCVFHILGSDLPTRLHLQSLGSAGRNRLDPRRPGGACEEKNEETKREKSCRL